jgi:predicted HTH domain antitoxin
MIKILKDKIILFFLLNILAEYYTAKTELFTKGKVIIKLIIELFTKGKVIIKLIIELFTKGKVILEEY